MLKDICMMQKNNVPAILIVMVCFPFAFAQAEVDDIKPDATVNGDIKIATESLPVIEVIGKRASLASAQEIKQEKIEILSKKVRKIA